jgi:anti-sigma-K factor RskA
MRDSTPHADFPEDLALLALLYSSGELEGEEATKFEARLAVDQEARDAVAQAVQLSLTAAGERCAPDAAWREETKRRLLQRASLWQRMAGPRVYRGHPAVWSIFGALAASLVLSLMPAPAMHDSTAKVEHVTGESVEVLEQKAQQLTKELADVNEELARAKKNREVHQ